MTFGGDSERGIEQTRRATAAAKAIGNEDLVLHLQIVELTYTALVAPGTDEALRLADAVGREIDQGDSLAMRQMWLQGAAAALAPLDRDRALAMLDEAVELASLAALFDGVATAEFWRGIVLFTARDYPGAASAWRRALVISHDRGNRRAVTNVLSGVVGLVLRTGRVRAAAVLLAGLHAVRMDYGLPGSVIERDAEARIGEHLLREVGDAGAASPRPLDIEATIDLALATLEEIVADGQPE
jgi:tetratricopeptide (TPR) repeat protein